MFTGRFSKYIQGRNKDRILYQSYMKTTAYSYIDKGMVSGYKQNGADVVIYDAKSNKPPLKRVLQRFRPTHFVGFLQEVDRTTTSWTEIDNFRLLDKYKEKHGLIVALRSVPTNMSDYVENYLQAGPQLRNTLTDFYTQADRPDPAEKVVLESGFVDFFRSPMHHDIYPTAFRNLLERGYSVLEEPHAADHVEYKPSRLKNTNGIDVLFVGGSWGFKFHNMKKYINALQNVYGDRLSIYGRGWPEGYSKGVVTDRQYKALVKSARINLSFHEPVQVRPFPVNSGNERIYKLLAMKRFVITDDNPLLHYHFDIPRELVAASSPADLVDKCQYYLKNPIAAERVAENGYRRVLESHTYKHRACRLLEVADQKLYLREKIIKYQ